MRKADNRSQLRRVAPCRRSPAQLAGLNTQRALRGLTPFQAVCKGMITLLCRPLVRPSLLLCCLANPRAQRLQQQSTSTAKSSVSRAPPAAAAAAAAATAGASGPPTTPAGMVQTRAATAAQMGEQCRLERVVSNLQASCSQEPTAPPVRCKIGVGWELSSSPNLSVC